MANSKTAAKFNQTNGQNSAISKIEGNIQEFNNALDPNSGLLGQNLPFYGSGARALIRIGGRPLSVCQQISWEISYNVEPIITVDSNLPWDQDVGTCRISASLGQIMDPTGSLETQGLFHVMSAAVHQPYVELQVLDKNGCSILYAKGMFTGMTGSVAKGQLSNWGAKFSGVTYQHWVSQDFKPGSTASNVSGVVNGLVNSLSGLSGGLL